MPTEHVVARADELQVGESKLVSLPPRSIALFRTEEGFSAIDDMCPHMGASLAGGYVEEGCVTCPWHYWRFRLTDGAWADNPRIKIGSYPVSVFGNEVRLTLPDSA